MGFSVRRATRADRPELAALLREMIPGCDVDARIKWLYETNPGGRALTWFAIADGGEVAGCTSFFPFELWLDGTIVHAALGGDGYVRPAYRRHGLGGLLHEASRHAMVEHDIGCMYGAPGAMNLTPLKHGGSREIGHVARWVRPVRMGAIGLRAAPLELVSRALLRPRITAKLEPMQRNDARVDLVWEAARTMLRLAAVRDASFYTWRFLDAPARKEPAYVITARGRPIGVCALESMNGGKDLRIVDLMTLPEAWHSGLRAIARYAIDETRVETVDIKLMELDGRDRMMWRSGFTERDHKPFLVMVPKDGDRRFLDPDRWFYGGADSDLDSLE